MQFIDLAAQQQRIRDAIETRIRTVLDHGKYIMGPEVGELEAQLARFSGAREAIACASGTDALLMSLMAHDIGPGHAVITTPFTFIATAEVIGFLGATPVFADIDPVTYNIDPRQIDAAVENLKQRDPALTAKAVIAVDLFGLPADYDAIDIVARKHGLAVIEDAAQSFGAVYKGQRAGSLTEIACTSFFPAKPLGCYGDGGAVLTGNPELADKMRSIRIHGQGSDKYDNIRIGINGRLDTLQASILLAKLDIFEDEIGRRQEAAERYTRSLSRLPGLITPTVPANYTSVWAQYSLLAEDAAHRTALQAALKDKGIPTAIYYPKPLHLQTAFADLPYQRGDFPVSEEIADRIFSIPMHPYLDEGQQEQVISAIKSA
jgi:dTDP-4-amino-4,6-dideoxygalactose transaminase